MSALVAMAAAARGLRVLAVDTDVVPNLGLSLGLDQAGLDRVRTVPRALVTGRGGGSVTTAQLLAGYGVAVPTGVTLLHAMPRSEDPGGCCCPAHASARSLLASALDEEADVSVLDMEAGLEHLDRPGGTIAHTDVLLVVMEPSRKSYVTAARMIAMARSQGIERIALVGNKGADVSGNTDDAASFIDAASEMAVPVAGVVPASPAVADADRAGAGLDLGDASLRAGVDGVLDSIR